MPFRIRDFEPQDFERLWQIDQECFIPGISYSRPELKTYMRRRSSFTLVAEDEHGGKLGDGHKPDIGGFIVAFGGATGHIITIDVIASARRLGLGSQLLAAAEDRLRGGGSHGVRLEAAVDNMAAIAFYKRHRYSVVATWPRYYSNGVDALVMKKAL